MSKRDLELARMRDAVESGEPIEGALSLEEHASATPPSRALERPDGSVVKTAGILLLVLGALLSLWAEFMSVAEYSWSTDIDPNKVAMKVKLAFAGGGLFQIGLFVWLGGYIVHAISFLPGRRN